jgi:hypothetical protein
MKRFIFDAIMASISVGGLSYELYLMIEKLIEQQYGTSIFFACLALIMCFFTGFFWGCVDADLEKMFPKNTKNPRVA